MSTIADVTIIIKTHQRQAECNRLIASIRRFYPSVRIIVGDDSQTPADIVRADRVERFEYDIGLSAGRNRLVDLVETAYVLLVDDDCLFYESTRLEEMIAVLDAGRYNLVGGNMGWETMHGCLKKDGDILHILKGAFRNEDAQGNRRYDFCHNFFMARTDVMKQARWPEEIKIYAEHVHFFWANRQALKVTKCNVSVGHCHVRDSGLGDIAYERMRRRKEFLQLSNQMLGIRGRRITDAMNKPLAEVRTRVKPAPVAKTRLLGLKHFRPIFEELRGKRIGYAPNFGNCGDDMITQATVQLFTRFGLDWQPWREGRDYDVLLFGGGGSMGGSYYSTFELRQKLLASGLPVIVLPQSFMGPEAGAYAKVYVRERDSLQHAPDAILAPDLALGMEWLNEQEAVYERGLFLRRDLEGLFEHPASKGDPARLVQGWADYLRLAGQHGWIITDRLHFAIAGLLCGRRVTLLPNSYHKNRSMYDTWLKDLGCEWSDAVPEDTKP